MANPNPEAPNGADPANPAAVLDDLEALRQQRDEFLNLLQRTQADFQNYQKRVQRDLAQDRRYASGPLAADLLPVLDNLDRALEAARKAGDQGPLVQGIGMVQTQLLDALRRHGITPTEALGKPFDPNLHEAVLQQPSAEQAPDTVAQVLEQGFQIHDRVLRPAKVAVTRKP